MRRLLKSSIMLSVVTAGALLTQSVAPMAAEARAAEARSTPPVVQVLTKDVVAPVQLAVHDGKVYVGDAARSTLTKLGYPVPLATGPRPGEIAGVDFKAADYAMAYTALDQRTGQGTVTIRRRGYDPVVADVSRYERLNNPDGAQFYGVRTSDPCVSDALAKLPLPSPRPAGYWGGNAEVHPYAVAAGGHDDWYVVDSGANDLLRVDKSGRISLVAVLPAQPHIFTQGDATALGLPACVVGVRYAFEPVPTDVEVGPDGALYVSLLPGGPQSLQLGARGSVYRVDPNTGDTKLVATGLGGAVNLALGHGGRIYVAELFSGQISVITPGKGRGAKATVKPLIKLPYVVAVESDGGALYASTLSPDYLKGLLSGNGSIVKIG